MTTHHFLCCGTDANGEKLDLIVEAANADEAMTLWTNWLDNEFEAELDENEDVQIFRLPGLTGRATIVEWHGSERGRPVATLEA